MLGRVFWSLFASVNLLVGASCCLGDAKSSSSPSRRYVFVPVPEQQGLGPGGGGSPAIDAKAERIAFAQPHQSDGDPLLWLYLIEDNALRFLDHGASPVFSDDGSRVAYHRSVDGVVIYDILQGETSKLSLPNHSWRWFAFDGALEQWLGVSDRTFDPDAGPIDGSLELFVIETAAGTARQLTSLEPLREAEIHGADLSADGNTVAFSAVDPLYQDPFPIPVAYIPQVYVVPAAGGEIRRLTGIDGSEIAWCDYPSLSGDGRLLACAGNGLFLVDTQTGEYRRIVGLEGRPDPGIVSRDGKKVAFRAHIDVDPEVGNEDLNPEVFLFDVESGSIVQVTDTVSYPTGPGLRSLSADASTIVVAYASGLKQSRLSLSLARYMLAPEGDNEPPYLLPVDDQRVAVGGRAVFTLDATDPEGSVVVLHAQRLPGFPFPERLVELDSELFQGTSDVPGKLILRPSSQGQFPIRVAAFDSVGGMAVDDFVLTVVCPSDCDASNEVSVSELVKAIAVSLGQVSLEECDTADVDGDRVVRINELIQAVSINLAGSC